MRLEHVHVRRVTSTSSQLTTRGVPTAAQRPSRRRCQARPAPFRRLHSGGLSAGVLPTVDPACWWCFGDESDEIHQ